MEKRRILVYKKKQKQKQNNTNKQKTIFYSITYTIDATASSIKDINNIFIDLFQVDQNIFAERKNKTNL